MELEKIIASSADFLNIVEEIKSGKLAKSILLISKDELYAFQFAKLLASSIFAGGEVMQDEHFEKVQALAHPDLKIYPAKDRLMVADSDNIVEESAVKPIFANKKVFIIKHIDNGLEQAQNKLLKTLEEPASNVFFILTTSNLHLVLPTIRSRCNKIELGKLPLSTIKPIFVGYENVDLILALSEGYLGKALALAKKENLGQIFDAVMSVVCKMKTSKYLLQFSKKLIDLKENLNFLLEIMSMIFEDLLLIKAGKSNRARFKNYVQELKFVEGEYSVKAIAQIRSLIDNAVKELSYSGNATVVLENLLLNILEVKYICR